MKAITKLLSGFILALGLAGSASAATFTLDDIFSATKLAVSEYSAANPTHVEHIIGFKGWKSEDDAKVIVYVNHDGMAMNQTFNCHKHDGSIECHAQ